MPILELCAGYGGLGLAVEELTGDKVTYVAEVDEAASKILEYRFPGVPNIGDITKYDWAQLEGLIDVITAGFPCQDISNAGKRKGIEGERSGIWKNVCEAVGVLRPQLVFLENVAAIRTRGLSTVSEDLAGVGYDLLWTTLRASEVGAPHLRPRWFGLAISQDADSSAWDLWSCTASRKETGGGHGPTLSDEACFLLPHSHDIGRNRRAGHEPSSEGRDELEDSGNSPAEWWGDYLPAVRRWEFLTAQPGPAPTELGPRGGRRLTARFAEWMMGLPNGWVTDVPGLVPPKRDPRSKQLKAIGNGVVPQQAYAAFSHLLSQVALMKEIENA